MTPIKTINHERTKRISIRVNADFLREDNGKLSMVNDESQHIGICIILSNVKNIFDYQDPSTSLCSAQDDEGVFTTVLYTTVSLR